MGYIMNKPQDDFLMNASQLRFNQDNQNAFLEALASRLQMGLPGMVEISRYFSLFKKQKAINTITVLLNNEEFKLSCNKQNQLNTSIGNVVRGIVLKTESVSISEWLERLAAATQQYAKTHGNAVNILEEFLMQ